MYCLLKVYHTKLTWHPMDGNKLCFFNNPFMVTILPCELAIISWIGFSTHGSQQFTFW